MLRFVAVPTLLASYQCSVHHSSLNIHSFPMRFFLAGSCRFAHREVPPRSDYRGRSRVVQAHFRTPTSTSSPITPNRWATTTRRAVASSSTTTACAARSTSAGIRALGSMARHRDVEAYEHGAAVITIARCAQLGGGSFSATHSTPTWRVRDRAGERRSCRSHPAGARATHSS